VFKAKPSQFAQALCGVDGNKSTKASLPTQRQAPSLSFGWPYLNHETYLDADPFAKPSPDDVILAAQQNSNLN
jgi:elongation factor 1 alpha-like protein